METGLGLATASHTATQQIYNSFTTLQLMSEERGRGRRTGERKTSCATWAQAQIIANQREADRYCNYLFI
jgi:hypothetical protein